MPTTTPSLAYRPDIDGLRAIAVLLVVVFHFDLVPAGKAGFLGVDVFFVISGFLITSIIKQQMDAQTFSLGTFYLNRIRRLAPALFVTLALVMAVGILFLFPSDLEALSLQAALSQFYVANIYYWRSINYFGLQADSVYLLHTWSLAIEEQFYLLYPLAFLLVYRSFRRFLPAALVAAFILSMSLNLWLVGSKPEATFYLLPTRAWELLAGALIVFLPEIPLRLRQILGWSGLGLIALAVAIFGPEIAFPGSFALLPTAGAAAIIIAGTGRPTPVSRFLSQRPLVYVGRISYPLYLVHWPINVFAGMGLSQGYNFGWRAAMALLSFALAAAIFHWIETPIRQRRFLSSDRRVIGGYAAGLTATALAFLAIFGTGGMPTRFPPEVRHLASFTEDKTPALTECHYASQPSLNEASLCRIGTAKAKPQWLIYGDSHAWAVHDALDKWLRASNQGGYFIFRSSCPPVTGVHLVRDKGDCFAFNRAVTEFLENNAQIEGVFLVSSWLQPREGVLTSSPDVALDTDHSIGLFKEQFAATIRRLSALGKHVYVWEPVPGALSIVPTALARAKLWNRPSRIEIARMDYLTTFDFFFDALADARRWITKTVPTADALCASGRCAVTVSGNPLYFDNSHVTRSSSDFWAGVIQQAVGDGQQHASNSANARIEQEKNP